MAKPVLVSLPVSPYSQRAAWALDHHRIAWSRIVHEPFIGERKLRRLAKTPPGQRATAPVLIAGGDVVTDSTAIARWADRHGTGSPLFPAGHDDAVERFVTMSTRVSDAGRHLVSIGMLRNDRALDETLPPQLGPVRVLLRPITRHGTRWFARKYDLPIDDDVVVEAALRAATDRIRQDLLAIRAALDGHAFVVADTFSWADIVVALMLQSVKPVEHPAYPFPAATRQVWTHPVLVDEFADLVAWRDRLFAEHR